MLEFYIHHPISELNERRALLRIGRLLHQMWGSSPETYYLVANLNKDYEPVWRERHLTQLDAVLVGPYGVTLIEIKEYAVPFDATNLENRWPILEHGNPTRQSVRAGRSDNPFLQVKNARERWVYDHFIRSDQLVRDPHRNTPIAWHRTSAALLFSPYLHEESRVPHFAEHDKWFTLAGLEEIAGISFANRSELMLSESERKRLVTQVLLAKPWPILKTVLEQKLGTLYIESELPNQTHLIDLIPHETLTIGRSRDNRVQIPDLPRFRHVSRKHLQIDTDSHQVTITDLGTTKQTLVDGKRLLPHRPYPLKGGESILLAGQSEGNCIVRFTVNRITRASGQRPTWVTNRTDKD